MKILKSIVVRTSSRKYVVFLILGGNPASQGARDWASEKPNMLNVAITRAKKRFYVIGNKNLWGKCPYFDVMAARLPEIKILKGKPL